MRWNCPHCGVGLTIENEKLSEGWNFSRCYSCGGFGLVRRSEVNLIKVERAPQGAPVVLPELSNEPILGQQATQNLQAIRAQIEEQKRLKNTSAEAIRKAPSPPPLPRAAIEAANANTLPTSAIAAANTAAPKNSLSTPLLAFGLASLAAGGFFFVQGKRLVNRVERERPAAAASATSQSEPNPMARSESADAGNAAKPTNSLTDQVAQRSMAPERATRLSVRALKTGIFLRSGPGTEYPPVGKADPEAIYSVTDWKDRWLQVQVSPEQIAWVRNDLVSLISR